MIEIIVTIKNKAGLHTRPAATIVKLAAKYECEFFISRRPAKVHNAATRKSAGIAILYGVMMSLAV